MTEHLHTRIVEGCFRCELGKDEMAAIEAENEKVLACVMRKILKRADIADLGSAHAADPSFISFERGTIDLTDEEFDILEEVREFG